ncbi:hypothetical protein FJZ18_02200 [Candidatus Pacearchaeota archaeon]|nr:hypothetical protein [Candidatus Pacearchaeota archaeon]
MAFKEFLRKVFANKEGEQKEQEIKTYGIEEIKKMMREETKRIQQEAEKTKDILKESVSKCTAKLNSHKQVLEKIDLHKRKENERLKQINLENIKLYCSNVQRLIEELYALESLAPEEYIEALPSKVAQFESASAKNFERATLFIGKEMAAIPSTLREFSREYYLHCKEYALLFNKKKSLAELQNLFNEHASAMKGLAERGREFLLLNEKISDTKKKHDAFKSEKEKILTSQEYHKCEHEKKQRSKSLENIKEEAQALKERLKLKNLAAIYHADEKKNELIKKYNANFLEGLESDESLAFAELVSAAYPAEPYKEQIVALNKRHNELKEINVFPIEEQLIKTERSIQRSREELAEIEKIIEIEKRKENKMQEHLLNLEKSLQEKALIFSWKVRIRHSEEINNQHP